MKPVPGLGLKRDRGRPGEARRLVVEGTCGFRAYVLFRV